MNKIIIHYPKRLVLGEKSLEQLAEDYLVSGYKRLYIITVPPVAGHIKAFKDRLETGGIMVQTDISLKGEPSFSDFRGVLTRCRRFEADSIAGIGGGSVMDVAKLVAAVLYSGQGIESIAGNGLLKDRKTHLVCVPTTSGTGSEVSPNVILLDEADRLKKGIISPCLVPDWAYIDPELTVSLPPEITAYTAIDALTHCIEAYTNRYAHPIIDNIAIEGIRLICRYLKKAFDNGRDLEARSKLALGSVYGGMCLGPVNTAAVHALAYPLGSEFKIAHGLSNALLLPYVMEYNLGASVSRYYDIAKAMGVNEGETEKDTAFNGISFLKNLIRECKLPLRLSDLGISSSVIDDMAQSAIKVQRLLQNNIRELNIEDIKAIYRMAS
ncbi:MAG: iron-containing alcohol dehydrogenase [Bacteroidales bacterium]|nr:iron-containing alcohol dehydrogenase [Bacteroidales bacterium]